MRCIKKTSKVNIAIDLKEPTGSFLISLVIKNAY